MGRVGAGEAAWAGVLQPSSQVWWGCNGMGWSRQLPSTAQILA